MPGGFFHFFRGYCFVANLVKIEFIKEITAHFPGVDFQMFWFVVGCKTDPEVA